MVIAANYALTVIQKRGAGAVGAPLSRTRLTKYS
jgi:hypothetical protein